MNPSPNSPKIDAQVDALRRLRAAGDAGLPVGWEPGEIPPTTAHALERAGLAMIGPRTDAGQRVFVKPEGKP